MSDGPYLVGFCDPACAGRKAAMVEGQFLWSPARRSWIVPDWTPRTAREAYYGVSVSYVTCPWCGRDLPEIVTPEMGVSDGETEC